MRPSLGTAIRWLAIALVCVEAAVAAQPAPALAPWTGGGTPALALRDMAGGTHDLAAYRGRVVLINFWATWCEPCRAEMPSMQRLRDKLAGKPFVVLAVNVDEPDASIRRFLEETRFDLPVLLDPNKTATRAWSVRVMPTSFLIGPDGRIRYRLQGDIDWSNEAVVATIAQLMSSK